MAVHFFTPILPYALAFAAGAMIFVVVEGYDISGSANWFNRADLGATIYREIENEVQVKCWKARFPAFGKRYATARLKRDPRTGRLSSIGIDDEDGEKQVTT